MHITKKKKLIQRRHQSKKTESITIRATKIDIVICRCKNSIEKNFVGHKKLSPSPILANVVLLRVHLAISFGDLTVGLQLIRSSVIFNSLCSTRVYLLMSEFFAFLFLVLPFKKGIQICTTSVFRVEDGGGTFL
jgi:hypothetical protein